MIIDDIADYLEDQGYGTVGTDIFTGNFPDQPDNIVYIRDTGGAAPDAYIPTEDKTFQILIRSTSYAAAQTKAENIAFELHRNNNTTFQTGGDYSFFVLLQGSPGHIGRDESEREEFSMNFRLRIRR